MARVLSTRPTARVRLAGLLAVLFLIAGMLLLALSYALVRSQVNPAPPSLKAAVQKAGGVPTIRAPVPLPGKPGSALPVPLPPPKPPAAVTGLGPPPGAGAIRVVTGNGAGVSLARVQRQLASGALHRLLIEYLLILAALAVAAAAGGWFVAGRVLRPVKQMTTTARAVSHRNLSERIAHPGPDDELKELADTFDEMLARLEAAFDRQRVFIANASHELRTPLTAIRTEADVALEDPDPDVEGLLEAMRRVRAASARSARMIDGLLTLGRVERIHPATAVADMSKIAGTVLRDAKVALEASSLEVTADLAPAPVRGDHRLLETMARNLVDNAVRYSAAGGDLQIETRLENGWSRLRLRNGGALVPAEVLAGLTQPFQRGSRAQGTEGVGLGLSIVEAVAVAHGGCCRLRAPADGGLEVEVELPGARSERRRHALRARPQAAALAS